MKAGFVPALGTPLNENGDLCKESFAKQIRDQIQAGAVGLLCMGSMGIQSCIRQEVFPQVAAAAVEAAAGQVPVFVGAMDTSIARAKARMAAMEALDVAGFVFTAPYYSACSREQMMHFFRQVAGATQRPILLYDLPSVTQSKITFDMVLELLAQVPNFAGIKSADLQMFRKLKLDPRVPEDFILVYSGLDTCDIAYQWGIGNGLDGMFSCTPVNTGRMYRALEAGDRAEAAACLNRILALRDAFLSWDLWPAYSQAMNLLGCQGSFCPDYCGSVRPEYVPQIRKALEDMGEL